MQFPFKIQIGWPKWTQKQEAERSVATPGSMKGEAYNLGKFQYINGDHIA